MNELGQGQRLWQRAKSIIPGGNQLLSKRAERFLPDLWPSYYSRAKGCEVWDLDGRHYYDFAQMGVGSCVLGYADDDVDRAVVDAVANGNMCTLNCHEEVELAERLIGLHSWSDMARFARTGGEACSIAVRIARAATRRDVVAFCGYHGWHDWYLASNLGDNRNLDGQLLPGLDPVGVPGQLRGSAVPFHYNDLVGLRAIADRLGDQLAAVIMEPERGAAPAPGFLEGVRGVASKAGAVLIFDEVTSGFRMNMGGIHMTLGVQPDIAVFGKGMSNGFPCSAIIGRREVMDHAQSTFISSTYWTERVGFAAALATLGKMERLDVPAALVCLGQRISEGLDAASRAAGIGLRITGIPPLLYLAWEGDDPAALQTFFAQEMLAEGFLSGGAIYATFAYTEPIIDRFLDSAGKVLVRARAAMDGAGILAQLRGPVIQKGFRRLT